MQARITDLYDLSHSIAGDYLTQFEYPWEALAGIKDFILALGPTLPADEFDEVKEGVWIARDATVFDSAYLGEAIIIDHGAQVRHGAFLRGPAIVGKGSVAGNSAELKNVIIFDNAEVPHYNYVGDSILGYHAHMGAGAITSNLKSDRRDGPAQDGRHARRLGRGRLQQRAQPGNGDRQAYPRVPALTRARLHSRRPHLQGRGQHRAVGIGGRDMCGIVGYTGKKQAQQFLLEGLAALEYRGYDSAGLEVLSPDGELHGVKCSGRVATLAERCKTANLVGTQGIAHTRWATHGAPTDRNAHPHLDCTGRIAIVHNGIIENFQEIRSYLRQHGHTIATDTDTEVIAHLIRATWSPPPATRLRACAGPGRSQWSAPTRRARSSSRARGLRSSWPARPTAPMPPPMPCRSRASPSTSSAWRTASWPAFPLTAPCRCTMPTACPTTTP